MSNFFQAKNQPVKKIPGIKCNFMLTMLNYNCFFDTKFFFIVFYNICGSGDAYVIFNRLHR